ncbi:MAG: 5-formyltetrahydrofolate cyclo-ligase [Fibrobacterales bacterium]
MQSKTELRQFLRSLPIDISQSEALRAHILSLPEWNNAKNIAGYMPMDSEAHITPILKSALTDNKKLYLPWITPKTNDIALAAIQDLKNDLAVSHYGILEPKDELKKTTFDPVLDIILVPGIGFDRTGNRIGHGKGYYDRLLAKTEGLRCGICFESHLVEQVPTDTYDQKMDLVITEKRVIRIS